MIKLININLMRLEDQFYYNPANENECFFVVNVMVDPSKVTNVQTYKKQPLSTVCFKVSKRVMDKLNYIFNKEDDCIEVSKFTISSVINDYCHKVNLFSYLLMFLPFKAINQFSDAEEYQELVSKFIHNDYYSTYIFKFDVSDEDFDRVYAHMIAAEAKGECEDEDDSLYNYDQTIVIGAFPINGIMRPIQRSENYVIYNGCFIRTEAYYYDDIYNMPYICASVKDRVEGSQVTKAFEEESIKMGYLYYQYKMTAYAVINLYTTFSLFTTDRVSLTQGIITEHRLSGYYDEDITHDHVFPMYSQMSYGVPVTNEKMFTSAPGNLFPINDRPYYALPGVKNKPLKINFNR